MTVEGNATRRWAEEMLQDVLLFDRPYRHFHCFTTFSDPIVEEARQVLAGPLPWEQRVGSFYVTYRFDMRAYFADRPAPAFVDPEFLETMRLKMAELFEVPLSRHDIQVLGHKMIPGQEIGVHNDNPGLGYESYRMVVQFTDDHRPEDGGLLNVHTSERPEDIYQSVRPCTNMSFGFEMSSQSYHSVTRVLNRDRDALIFNFWHVGNTPDVENVILKILDEMRDDEDPPLIAELSERVSRAGTEDAEAAVEAGRTAARLMRRWGGSARTAGAAFAAVMRDNSRWQSLLGDLPPENDAGDDGDRFDPRARDGLLALVCWIARARKRMFSPQLWNITRERVVQQNDALPRGAKVIAAVLFPHQS